MDLASKVVMSVQNMDLGPGSVLSQMGFPSIVQPGDRLETASWTYHDTLDIPLTVLGDLSIDTELFQSNFQGIARNLSFPFPADVGFVFDTVTCYADIGFDDEVTTEDTPYTGSWMGTAANRLLQAINISSQVSQKNYINEQLAGWTNYQMPIMLPTLIGQAADVQNSIFPPTYQNHHRINLPLSPEVVWPASSTVHIYVRANTKNWWSQVTQTLTNALDFTVAPWTYPIRATLYFQFIGMQVRRVK